MLAGDAEVNNVKDEENHNINGNPDTFIKDKQHFYIRYYCDGRGWYTYKYDLDKKDVEYEQIALAGYTFQLFPNRHLLYRPPLSYRGISNWKFLSSAHLLPLRHR